MGFSDQSSSKVPTPMAEHWRQQMPSAVPLPRARPPVIEMNLNLEEAIVETVDLIRTARVQLASLSNTIGQGLNRTVADVGDDIGRIIGNVEAISRNVAESTGQLYQPLLLFLLFVLFMFILLAILFCLIFRTQWEMRRLTEGRRRNLSTTTEEEGEEMNNKNRRKRRKEERKRKRKPFWWRWRKRNAEEEEEEEEKKERDHHPTGGQRTARGAEFYTENASKGHTKRRQKEPLV